MGVDPRLLGPAGADVHGTAWLRSRPQDTWRPRLGHTAPSGQCQVPPHDLVGRAKQQRSIGTPTELLQNSYRTPTEVLRMYALSTPEQRAGTALAPRRLDHTTAELAQGQTGRNTRDVSEVYRKCIGSVSEVYRTNTLSTPGQTRAIPIPSRLAHARHARPCPYLVGPHSQRSSSTARPLSAPTIQQSSNPAIHSAHQSINPPIHRLHAPAPRTFSCEPSQQASSSTARFSNKIRSGSISHWHTHVVGMAQQNHLRLPVDQIARAGLQRERQLSPGSIGA